MDSTALPCIASSFWQGFRLTASLLIFWLTSTFAQLTIESMPPISAEGDNVLLFVHNLPENVQAFSWYTGVMVLKSREIARYAKATNSCVLGTAHSGRETIFSNGSLLIKNVTRKDSGYYLLQTLDTSLKSEITRVEFFVHTPIFGFKKHAMPSKLTIELVPPVVAEEDNVLLLARNLPDKLQGFAWHKGVLPLDHFKIASHAILINSSMLTHKYYGRATIYTNGSLLLQNVTQKDSGIYTLRTISADLRSEWAIVNLQVNRS